MHHDRRKILEIGEDRRGIGIAGIGFAQIVPRAQKQHFPVQRGVGFAVAAASTSPRATDRPRATSPRCRRHGQARHCGSPAPPRRPGRRPRRRPPARWKSRGTPLASKRAIGVDAVAHRGGKETFRRQAVSHAKAETLAGFHQPRDQGAMAFRRAGDKAAAMEIEDDAACRGLGAAAIRPGSGPAGRPASPRRRRCAEAGEQGGIAAAQLDRCR